MSRASSVSPNGPTMGSHGLSTQKPSSLSLKIWIDGTAVQDEGARNYPGCLKQHEVLVTPKRGVALLCFQLGESMRSLYFTRFCTQWSLQSIYIYRCYHSKPARAEISEILPFSILIAVGDVMRAVKICQNVRQPSADSRGIAFSTSASPFSANHTTWTRPRCCGFHCDTGIHPMTSCSSMFKAGTKLTWDTRCCDTYSEDFWSAVQLGASDDL